MFGRHLKPCNSPRASRPWASAVVRFALAFSLLLNPLLLQAQIASTTEYRIKANFLAKVPSFVEWPAQALLPDQSPFLICLLGDISFGLSLGASISGKTIQQKRVEIRGVRIEQDLHSCHILFVSQFERKKYGRVLESVQAQNVLTVGETPEFLDAGGIVSLSFQRETLQFDVNLIAANKAHLKISSQLLALAKHVINSAEAAKI